MIYFFHTSFFFSFTFFLAHTYLKSLRGNDNLVTMNNPTPQTVVPKYHYPPKGTRATWRNG